MSGLGRVPSPGRLLPAYAGFKVQSVEPNDWDAARGRAAGFQRAPPHFIETLVLNRSPAGQYFAAFSEIPPDEGCLAPNAGEDALVFVQRSTRGTWESLGLSFSGMSGLAFVEDMIVPEKGAPLVLFSIARDMEGAAHDLWVARCSGTAWVRLGGAPVCSGSCWAGSLAAMDGGLVAETVGGAVGPNGTDSWHRCQDGAWSSAASPASQAVPDVYGQSLAVTPEGHDFVVGSGTDDTRLLDERLAP